MRTLPPPCPTFASWKPTSTASPGTTSLSIIRPCSRTAISSCRIGRAGAACPTRRRSAPVRPRAAAASSPMAARHSRAARASRRRRLRVGGLLGKTRLLHPRHRIDGGLVEQYGRQSHGHHAEGIRRREDAGNGGDGNDGVASEILEILYADDAGLG